MIFLFIGLIFTTIGVLYTIYPAPYEHALYGYRSERAKESPEAWDVAQKSSRRYFLLFGGIMAMIGFALRYSGNTNFFLIELLAFPWFIAPMFALIEAKLKKVEL